MAKFRAIINAVRQAITGNATTADVLSGKTFMSSASQNEQTGAMTNNGAVTASLTADGQVYTIPAGYHNGAGTVTANVSTDLSYITPTEVTDVDNKYIARNGGTIADIFNGVDVTAWDDKGNFSNVAGQTFKINLEFNAPVKIQEMINQFITNATNGVYAAYDCTLKASTDGITYNALTAKGNYNYLETATSLFYGTIVFAYINSNAYKYYQLEITAPNGYTNVAAGNIQFR